MSETLHYDSMVENALRGVVKQALEDIQTDGLPGDHHFYITFVTGYDGVQIPDYLRAKYPDEMTIVLQHQFWGLEITPERFEVGLSFNKIQEHLIIPFQAISAFADPSVQFGLQFRVNAEEAPSKPDGEPTDPTPPEDTDRSDFEEALEDLETENVVSLDHFRKK